MCIILKITISGIFLVLLSASTVAMELSCSIVHSLPIGSERLNFNAMKGTPVRRQQDYEDVCIIASVKLNSTDPTQVTFPKYQHIELFYASIPIVGSDFFRQFDEATLNLELRKGNVSELLYGKSKLNHLKISDTGLGRFEVLTEYDSNLQTLVIHERLITVLPTNVNFLSELKLLDLSGCSLTTVDLSQLNGLNLLSVLVLADNQLSSVEVGAGVDLPYLSKFDVQQNELSRIGRFPEMFPALKYARLMQNRWDCDWVSEVRDKIWHKNITVLGTDFRCGLRINNGGLCCTYAHPYQARVAIAKAMLSVLDELSAGASTDGDAGAQSIDPLITFKVFENETVDGVIGVETQNVGIYLQNPIGVV